MPREKYPLPYPGCEQIVTHFHSSSSVRALPRSAPPVRPGGGSILFGGWRFLLVPVQAHPLIHFGLREAAKSPNPVNGNLPFFDPPLCRVLGHTIVDDRFVWANPAFFCGRAKPLGHFLDLRIPINPDASIRNRALTVKDKLSKIRKIRSFSCHECP